MLVLGLDPTALSSSVILGFSGLVVCVGGGGGGCHSNKNKQPEITVTLPVVGQNDVCLNLTVDMM